MLFLLHCYNIYCAQVESTPVTTTSSSLASSQAVEDDTEGLSVGAIAGIAVAGAFAMLAVVVFAMIMQKKNKPEPLAVTKVDQEEQDLENATAASDTPSSNRG